MFMTSELEQYVNAPGRGDLVRQVREKINKLGINLHLLPVHLGDGSRRWQGHSGRHWERTAEKGFQLVYGSTANLFIDRHGEYIGYGPEASELVGIPDPETFVQLPWDKRVARVLLHLLPQSRGRRTMAGGHLTSDCRGNLRLHHAEFQKKHKMHLRMGCEPEMMWLKKDEDGRPDGGFSKPYCYHIDQFESLRPVSMRSSNTPIRWAST